MTYVDTSVLLAFIFAEDRVPPDSFWKGPLTSSRLAEYEVWTSIHARKSRREHADAARALLGRLAWVELAPAVLARALEPFPIPVRTLDALHLASMCFLRERTPSLEVATYDEKLAAAARSLKLKVVAP
ncbi:MAG TPA: type II toxin-antitoxin system VapC family toxin [Planctomycetota bacterium]|jgi:predicted nucleic acid-binding protein|nr:type II toxin-antitoxin system VapC family toxin [Planctomycetota bacterium]